MREKRRAWGVIVSVALGAALTLGAGRTAMGAAENWNDAQIKWMPYTEGLAAAKKTHRPICLIFHTTWCPHCANYSTVFSDPRVADKAKSFVMIRLDKDQNRELSKQYSPDGEYIPRTYFLSPQGKLDESLTEGRAQFKYFYNEKDPASLLAGMDRALKKFQ